MQTSGSVFLLIGDARLGVTLTATELQQLSTSQEAEDKPACSHQDKEAVHLEKVWNNYE